MSNQPKPTFGEVLRRLREARNLSARQLSLDAGLANSYVTQAENGDRGKRPGRDKVLALAQTMRTSRQETAELLAAAGLKSDLDDRTRPTFEEFVNGDPLLRADQKRALMATYATFWRGGQ